jgi:putative transposase
LAKPSPKKLSVRRTHSPEFKAMVAMEAISGRKTIREIVADHAVHPIQVSQWERPLLDGASELFTRGKKTKDKEESQAKEADLFQQIGWLQMEMEWLKKVSTSLMPMNCASWSITTTPSSASAASAPCWVCRDPRSTTGPRRCANRPCRSWPGLMLTTWRIPAAAVGGWWTTSPEMGSRSAMTESETSCGAWVAGDISEAQHDDSRRSGRPVSLSGGPQAGHIGGSGVGTDITTIPLQKGFRYLVAIVDLHSRHVLSWKLSNSLDTEFYPEALEMVT